MFRELWIGSCYNVVAGYHGISPHGPGIHSPIQIYTRDSRQHSSGNPTGLGNSLHAQKPTQTDQERAQQTRDVDPICWFDVGPAS